MSWMSGADGCRKGWFRASRRTETGELHFVALGRAEQLLSEAPQPDVLAIDIPIGLTERGPRECDRAARRCLGRPRSSSVFPAPVRAALAARTREEASRITKERDRRRVGTQAWALYPKIREVDALLKSSAEARRRVREVHPEVSFWAWDGGQPMRARKKSRSGRAQRRALVEAWLGPAALADARGGHRKRDVADDDILDALAALWTATRILGNRARTLPEDPPLDAAGLRMEIVY